ncbi:hypothetical protein WJX84_001612 [Apatococcus fuscideae]|uniref:Uncharacterized protein n=1 Tax=Apatococcus fuscideae TaxID=2026836 RepID=A0AAW1SFE5_9CHLO
MGTLAEQADEIRKGAQALSGPASASEADARSIRAGRRRVYSSSRGLWHPAKRFRSCTAHDRHAAPRRLAAPGRCAHKQQAPHGSAHEAQS